MKKTLIIKRTNESRLNKIVTGRYRAMLSKRFDDKTEITLYGRNIIDYLLTLVPLRTLEVK